MKIIIEVKGGCVWGVYRHGRRTEKTPDIAVVDLDGEQVGKRAELNWWTLMPLSEASGTTRKLIQKSEA